MTQTHRALRLPATLCLGLGIILACEVFLLIDIHQTRRGAIHSDQDAAALTTRDRKTWLAQTAKWVAIDMTPLAWLGYVIFLDGALTIQQGSSPARRRPHHFALCALASIVVWCVFDGVNFYCFKPPAWTYIGISIPWGQRFTGYAIAFAAELPAMFMTAQVLLNLRCFKQLRGPRWKMPPWGLAAISATGAAMLAWPICSGAVTANYTLWTSLVFLLDPINFKLGRPSMLRDWQNGWYGRTAALFAGGLLCGLLWEFWNYWARSKWVYHLSFLGSMQRYHYFEMPLPGLLGFIPFGMECWVMWQTLRIPLDGLAEPLPSERHLI